MEERTLIVLSNREPYEHVRAGNVVELRTPAGGLVSALDPTMQRTHGVWVAWGSGSADRAESDDRGRIEVPPEDPSYTLRRVWLDKGEIDGYYLGFANSVLWPVCHLLIQHIDFKMPDWDCYRSVNEKFAAAVLDELREAGGAPIVWVHDYHFALVPEMLRRESPSLVIHHFWHIPFPPPDILRLIPGSAPVAIVTGLLGNDLLEFHTERYARNFLDCVAEFVPNATLDRAAMRVTLDERTIGVGVFPISIDYERYDQLARSSESEAKSRELQAQYAGRGCKIGLGVDRLDYTKGIPERLRALDLIWTESPELRGRFTFLLVAPPSRSEVDAYNELERSVEATINEINDRHRLEGWDPIVHISEQVGGEQLAAFYRAADLCLVSSLQDGMNLVAKEFVACQVDECGVLVLSRFTGAAEEIEGAVLINPFNVGGFAQGIRDAIEMPDEERRRRMRAMREQISKATIFDWLDSIMTRVDEIAARRGAHATLDAW
jgi:alpha,alpha-trehalose-phosphate synthase [UDP-forming]